MKTITCGNCKYEWTEQINNTVINPMMPTIKVPRLCLKCTEDGFYIERAGLFPKFNIKKKVIT